MAPEFENMMNERARAREIERRKLISVGARISFGALEINPSAFKNKSFD